MCPAGYERISEILPLFSCRAVYESFLRTVVHRIFTKFQYLIQIGVFRFVNDFFLKRIMPDEHLYVAYLGFVRSNDFGISERFIIKLIGFVAIARKNQSFFVYTIATQIIPDAAVVVQFFAIAQHDFGSAYSFCFYV